MSVADTYTTTTPHNHLIMDSMRSLNTSLPRASPRRRPTGQQPPEELLSAFKAAALSVTNLYKTAASDQVRARAAGYQDALDDLLILLDKENLGLGDGEGWRVRQWATERLDGSVPARGESEDEEDVVEEEKARSSSPETSRKAPQPDLHTTDQPIQHAEAETSPAAAPVPQPAVHEDSRRQHAEFAVPQSGAFTFRSSHAYPTNHDREVDMDNASVGSETNADSTNVDAGSAPVRVEVVPRQPRNRHYGRSSNNRSSNNNNNSLGSASGAKRKPPFGDFFDISGLSFDGKDSSGRGGKRGRHV